MRRSVLIVLLALGGGWNLQTLDPVLFQYSIERSCHFAIVVIEDSAEPFASGDPAPAYGLP